MLKDYGISKMFFGTLSGRVVCWIILLSLMILGEVVVAGNLQQDLAGPGFSDPGKVYEMGDAWEGKKIVYQDWAKGADVALSLDQHFHQLFLPYIKEYAEKHSLDIRVQEGTCGVSGGVLAAKAVDIAGYCCSPSQIDRLPQLRFHTLGITALTILVHEDNPLDIISLEQAREIFQGKTASWGELGVDPREISGRINTTVRLHCKLRPGHWRSLLDNEDLFDSRSFHVGRIPDVIKQVAADVRSVGGFESMHMAFTRYPQKTKPKALALDGISPDNLEAVAAGRYPLYFVFNMTTWIGKAAENQNALDLLKYLKSTVDKIGFQSHIVPASHLRAAGWQFREDELVGVPQ